MQRLLHFRRIIAALLGALLLVPASSAGAIAAELAVTMNQLPISVPIVDYLVLDFDVGGQIVPMGFNADPEISKRRENFFEKNPGVLPVVQLRYLFYLATEECSGDAFLTRACESRRGSDPAQIVQMVLRSGSVAGVGTQMLRPADLSAADTEGEIQTYDQPGWTYVETLHAGSRLAASCSPTSEPGRALDCRHSASLANGIFYQVDFLLKDDTPSDVAEILRASHAAAEALTSP